MKKTLFIIALAFITSCSSIHRTMTNPDSSIEFKKDDFTITAQATAKASSTRILGIDWENLFKKKKFGEFNPQTTSQTGLSSASIPVFGGALTNATSGIFSFLIDNTAELATHNLITKNNDNDVVLYPRYQTQTSKPILGIGFIFKKTEVTVTARLGKLKQ